jgi:hypothetical protein
MIGRVSAVAAIALCLGQPAWASTSDGKAPYADAGRTQDYPEIAFVKGRCQFIAAGQVRPMKCNGVMYMDAPRTGRVSFGVMLDEGTWNFSGARAERPDAMHYHLLVDGVSGPNEDSDRSPATGVCDVEMSIDATTVRSLICTADTAGGGLSLTASGKTKIMDLGPPPPQQAKLSIRK